jgi:hypothetical protein
VAARQRIAALVAALTGFRGASVRMAKQDLLELFVQAFDLSHFVFEPVCAVATGSQ